MPLTHGEETYYIMGLVCIQYTYHMTCLMRKHQRIYRNNIETEWGPCTVSLGLSNICSFQNTSKFSFEVRPPHSRLFVRLCPSIFEICFWANDFRPSTYLLVVYMFPAERHLPEWSGNMPNDPESSPFPPHPSIKKRHQLLPKSARTVGAKGASSGGTSNRSALAGEGGGGPFFSG